MTPAPPSTGSQKSIVFRGTPVPGAEDRQRRIAGFDQERYSRSHVVCIGAGGIVSNIAPTLCRKGIGSITLLDDDVVEASNLNRQRFYARDIGRNKALALAENLRPECIAATRICGIPLRLEEAIACVADLTCDLAICGVDNNPARVAASSFFRAKHIPVIFSAVSVNADHGYVFVQEANGPCISCLFPDMADDDTYPCPGTPAVADILQAAGSLVVYVVDTLITTRQRNWNYRRIGLADGSSDGAGLIRQNLSCRCAKEN